DAGNADELPKLADEPAKVRLHEAVRVDYARGGSKLSLHSVSTIRPALDGRRSLSAFAQFEVRRYHQSARPAVVESSEWQAVFLDPLCRRRVNAILESHLVNSAPTERSLVYFDPQTSFSSFR